MREYCLKGMIFVKYKVHRLDVNDENMQSKLETFLNTLSGEAMMITPHIARTTLLQIYGVKDKIDYFLVVEKIG